MIHDRPVNSLTHLVRLFGRVPRQRDSQHRCLRRSRPLEPVHFVLVGAVRDRLGVSPSSLIVMERPVLTSDPDTPLLSFRTRPHPLRSTPPGTSADASPAPRCTAGSAGREATPPFRPSRTSSPLSSEPVCPGLHPELDTQLTPAPPQ